MKYPELEDVHYLLTEYNVEFCMNAVQDALAIYYAGTLTDICRPEKVRRLCSPSKWKEVIQLLSM